MPDNGVPMAQNDNLPDREARLPEVPPGFLGYLVGTGDFIKTKILPKLRRPEYPYYHRRYRRVPTVDECNADDTICIWEANQQYKRDRDVDKFILDNLRNRRQECFMHWKPDHDFKCGKEIQDFMEAERNWQMKHGDMGINATALNAYYKQKHRMVYERRHGPVGYGRKPPSQWKKEWEPSMHSTNFQHPEGTPRTEWGLNSGLSFHNEND